VQFGFKCAMGCTEAVFTLRTTAERFARNSVYMASLDIVKLTIVLYISNFLTFVTSGYTSAAVAIFKTWYS